MPHSKSKLSGPNQIHLASCNLPDFKGRTHRTERLTNIWLPQTDTEGREGGTHQTEKLANIDMVGGWARQTQRGDALDGKTNKHLATADRHRRGDAPDGKTKKY